MRNLEKLTNQLNKNYLFIPSFSYVKKYNLISAKHESKLIQILINNYGDYVLIITNCDGYNQKRFNTKKALINYILKTL